MLGKRSAQAGLFYADTMYLDFVGRDSFYGFLATQRSLIFCDEDFVDLYCLDNGRNSVPPSLMATVLLLQAHDRVSDEEAKNRADYDMRWKVALGIELDERPFAKSTLQLFRAQLILHDKARQVFTKSLDFARQTGYLKHRKIKAVLDTTFILGAGAVKDTYNLLADGIVQLACVLARLAGQELVVWATANGLARYVAPSIKGTAEINWDDKVLWPMPTACLLTPGLSLPNTPMTCRRSKRFVRQPTCWPSSCCRTLIEAQRATASNREPVPIVSFLCTTRTCVTATRARLYASRDTRPPSLLTRKTS
jgi:transposase